MKLTENEVREVARNVARRAIAPDVRSADSESAFPFAFVRALADSGLFGVLVPVEYGGAGLGIQELAAATAELAEESPSSALIMLAHSAACSAIGAAGASSLRQRVLPGLAQGRLLGGFAVHELSSGCMAAPVLTSARRTRNGFVLNGSKPFVTAANKLDLVAVLANLDSDGPSLFLLETSLPGVSKGKPEAALGLRGAGVAELALDECLVPEDALLGAGGDGLKLLRETLGTLGRFGTAGVAFGIARAIRASATEHARTRETGGVALCERPPVAAALADISKGVDAIEAGLRLHLTLAAQHSEKAFALGGEAKLLATEEAVRLALLGLQLAGGHGYFGASKLERLLRDALGLTVHLGPSILLRHELAISTSR